MTKNWKKFTAEKNLDFFKSKIAIYLSLGLLKDVRATGEAFVPRKRTSSISKLELSSLLWVILALLDPDPDPYSQCGSGSGTSQPN
jgi:hypothetical protein